MRIVSFASLRGSFFEVVKTLPVAISYGISRKRGVRRKIKKKRRKNYKKKDLLFVLMKYEDYINLLTIKRIAEKVDIVPKYLKPDEVLHDEDKADISNERKLIKVLRYSTRKPRTDGFFTKK